MSEKLRKLAQNITPRIMNEVKDNKLILTLSGNVGTPYWYDDKEEDFINENRVKTLVGDSTQDIIVRLNSPGGDVFDGIATYNYLKGLDNHVTVEVTALAASAASIIAMAGDEIVMCTGSQLMIHEASTFTWGNKSDHYKSINALESVDSSIVSVYAEKSGVDAEVIEEWLNGETWFTAEEAVGKGLAHRLKNTTPETIENKSPNMTGSYSKDEFMAIIDAKIKEFTDSLENKKQPEQPKNGLEILFGGKK